MESPVVIDKPPEYHGKGKDGRGFPFDEEEGSGAWSELAARHPDIAARLRQRPSTWTSKRRPTSQDADDFSDNFRGFDRFPFDEIPPEFRGHFPSHWNRRFGSRDETPPQQPAAAPQSPQPPQQTTAATQTELAPETPEQDPQTTLPQYGLRNTVDLGQKSPADPSLIDAQERGQRSMSAPPDNRSPTPNPNITNRKMSSQNHKDQGHDHPSNVRHIPIFVEGRDEPVINKTVDHGTHFADTKPAYASPPQQPHIDRDQYFADEGPTNFHHTPNFSRAFGTPFNKGFRQNTQPFVQQKVYPQNAFARGASPQRSQSPKQQTYPEEHYAKVPVQHEHAAPPSRPQQKQQQKPAPQQQHPPPPQQHQQQPPPGQHQHQTPPQHPPPREQTPSPKPQQTSSNDPITQILSIQTDVLNLMTDVENFTGTKKDKRYLFLDEMLTRNLIKLDTIETDGKENIRQARKEAIRCIQKCIAVLEAKAEKGNSTPQPQDVEMVENSESQQPAEQTESKENGEIEMKEADKENGEIDMTNVAKEEKKEEQTVVEEKETAEPQAADTRPVEAPAEVKVDDKANADKSEQNTDTEKKSSSKKIVKKRDKSKEPSNKEEVTMQVDARGVKEEMDVDASASQ